MWPEGEHETLFSALTRLGYESLDNKAVPDVHTVEEASRNYSHFTRGKSILCGRRLFLAYNLTPI